MSEDAVAGALDIMAYFGAHARVALVSAGVDPRAALARRIARWLIRFPDVVAFTERQAHSGVKVEGLRADDVRAALGLLDEYGYVRRAPPAGPRHARPRATGEPDVAGQPEVGACEIGGAPQYLQNPVPWIVWRTPKARVRLLGRGSELVRV